MPDVAIGRIPVRNAAEADTWLHGLMRAELAQRVGRTLLLSDNTDIAGDFARDTDTITGRFIAGSTTHVSLERTSITESRSQAFAALAAGTDLVHYVGHGGMDRFAAEGLVRSEDIGSAPIAGHPLVVALSCFVNRFDVSGFDPLGVRLARDPQLGALGVWAPLGRSVNADAHRLDLAFLDTVAQTPGARTGDVIVAALTTYAATSPRAEMLLTYVLLGDPASPLRVDGQVVAAPPPPVDPPPPPGTPDAGMAMDASIGMTDAGPSTLPVTPPNLQQGGCAAVPHGSRHGWGVLTLLGMAVLQGWRRRRRPLRSRD